MTREDSWGINLSSPWRIADIELPVLEWLGWNSGLDEYSTIVFTYPVAFVSILVVPLGYFF